MKKLTSALLLLLSAIQSQLSHSVTECDAKVNNYFIGTDTDGTNPHLWINFNNGGSASVNHTNDAFDGMVSSIMMSTAADKVVRYRLINDNANCATHNSDLIGMYIYK